MNTNRRLILRYASALVFGGLAFALVLLTPLRVTDPFFVFLGAVALTARYGGLGPALIVTIMTFFVGAYFFLPSRIPALSTMDTLRLLAFAIVSLLISSVTALREQAQENVNIRAQQQAAVAELGQHALTNPNLVAVMNEATELVCHTLGVEYCKVVELLPGGKELLLRSGYGWAEGVVGHTKFDAGPNSEAGYTLQCQEPVIVRNLNKEKRFSASPLLLEHDVVSGMSVIIHGLDKPFGILGAHTTQGRHFTKDDVHFLQAIANVLGAAVARAQTETQVSEQRNWLSVTLSSIGDAVITTDPAGNITLMNSAAQALTGFEAGQVAGKRFDEVLGLSDEETGEAIPYPIAAVAHGTDSPMPSNHTLLTTPNGRRVPIEFNAAAIRDEKGTPIGAVLTFRDVTDRRQAQDRLEFQATILQNVRDAVIVVDPKGQVLYWNPGAQAIFGYAAEEMLGRNVALLYPGEAGSLVEDLEKNADVSDDVQERMGRRQDGSAVWVDIHSTVLHNASGQKIGLVLVSSDITERKQADERLVAQYNVTRVLAESSSLDEATPKILRTICESVGWDVGIIWYLDPDADVLRCVDVWHLPTINISQFESLTREMLFPRGVGLPGQIWASGAPAWVPDISQEPNFPRGKVASKDELRAAFAFPITSGDQLIGVLEFFSHQLRPPDAALLEMMNSLGSQIGQFIERKRAEEALRLSREQQSIILRGVADGVTAQNTAGELIYANDAAAQLIGFASPKELLATPVDQVLARFSISDEAGESFPAERLPGRVAMQEKHTVENVLRFRTLPEGQERWSLVRASPVLDEQGNVQFTINIFHDVTERRRTEVQVREQRELLQVTLASIGDAVISTDARGNITFMNPVAEHLTGWSASEAQGQSLEKVLRILNEETGAVLESPASRVLREQKVVELSEGVVLVAKNGKRIGIGSSGAPIRNAQGALIGIVLVFRDITERRRNERDISRLASIVQSTDDAILSTNLEGIVTTWNPGAEQLYGYTADEMIGRSILITYPPDRQNEFRQIIQRLRQGQSTEHYETIRIRKDGKKIDVSITPSAILNSAGRMIGVSKIARDISERMREERAQQFLAQAGQVLASSLDYETTLRSVAQLAVPQVADWCDVHVRTDDGAIQQLALAHVDPNKVKLAMEVQQKYPPDPEAPGGVHSVIRTGEPILVRFISDDELGAAAKNVEHLKLLTELNPRSYMIVPLIAREQTYGAIAFVAAESGRRYDDSDLALAQELARRVALAVDNARLYREAQQLNEELERRVIRRTIELQSANRKLETEIAERLRANEQLRLLSAHLQSAREDERVRVAREIHDEIGQVLTAAKMDIALLEREMAKPDAQVSPDQLAGKFGATKKLLDQAIDTMHAIVRELRPEILDHLGLREAIEWQLQEFQTRTKINCEFNGGHDELEVDQERSIAIFRILQETLTNVARHSGATQVQVMLKEQDHHLLLEIRDNGQGIKEEALLAPKTFGILGMRERAHAFGGDVAVVGAAGQGTLVSVRIPL